MGAPVEDWAGWPDDSGPVALAYWEELAQARQRPAVHVLALMGLLLGGIRVLGYAPFCWALARGEISTRWHALSALGIERQGGLILGFYCVCLAAAVFLVISAATWFTACRSRRLLLWAFVAVLVVHPVESLRDVVYGAWLISSGKQEPVTPLSVGLGMVALVTMSVPSLLGIALLVRRDMADAAVFSARALGASGLMALIYGVARTYEEILFLPQRLEAAGETSNATMQALGKAMAAGQLVGWLLFACAGILCLRTRRTRRLLMICACIVLGLIAWRMVDNATGLLEFGLQIALMPIGKGAHDAILPLAVFLLIRSPAARAMRQN